MTVDCGARIEYELPGYGDSTETGIVTQAQSGGWLLVTADREHWDYSLGHATDRRRVHRACVLRIMPNARIEPLLAREKGPTQ